MAGRQLSSRPPDLAQAVPPLTSKTLNMRKDQVLAEVSSYLADEEGTEELAKQLAPFLTEPDEQGFVGARIHLKGELGAGKTHLVRALLRACGVTGRIK